MSVFFFLHAFTLKAQQYVYIKNAPYNMSESINASVNANPSCCYSCPVTHALSPSAVP